MTDRPAGSPSAGAAGVCPTCGSGGPIERLRLREMLFGTRETFEYARCDGCGVLWILDPPGDLAAHYPAAYHSVVQSPEEAPRLGRLARAADRARNGWILFGSDRLANRLLRRWAPPATPGLHPEADVARRAGLRSFDDPILDVGCGKVPGHLLRLGRLGFRRLLGVDPFLDGDGSYRGIPLRRCSIHEVTGTFQLVTLHHSFEHMPDPVETMAAAGRLLRPGGVLMIRTPVMGTWFWRTYGRDWWELDPPRHLFVHSRASLVRCADPAGLTLSDVAWDSTFVEIVASEQIRRDIAWREPASWGEAPPAGFDDATIEAHKAKAAELNAAGDAGRAAFFFRRAEDLATSPPRGAPG